ncbi:MAG: hypothetical protein DRQ52_07260, partial [Gammaproteobacteria bacterium]
MISILAGRVGEDALKSAASIIKPRGGVAMQESAEGSRSGPMFNSNRLKLGVFGTNVSNGCAVSLAQTSFEPTFEHNLQIAEKAERYGFEALVPVGRWKGFG